MDRMSQGGMQVIPEPWIGFDCHKTLPSASASANYPASAVSLPLTMLYMSLQMATVLEDTAKSIIIHETVLSCFVAIPRVSLHHTSGWKDQHIAKGNSIAKTLVWIDEVWVLIKLSNKQEVSNFGFQAPLTWGQLQQGIWNQQQQ